MSDANIEGGLCVGCICGAMMMRFYAMVCREPSFGHGILELKSPYEATFQW